MKFEKNTFGRGKELVKKQIKHIQHSVQNMSELQGNAGKPKEIRDLSRRIHWNEYRVRTLKNFKKKIEKKIPKKF